MCKLIIPKGYKLSPLFPATTPPSRPGVYLVSPVPERIKRPNNFSYWNGERWGVVCSAAELAETFKDGLRVWMNSESNWQGLLKDNSCANCGYLLREHAIVERLCPLSTTKPDGLQRFGSTKWTPLP